MEVKLKPCPFCGKECAVSTVEWSSLKVMKESFPDLNRTKGYYVNCMHCCANNNGLSIGFASVEIAVQKWNDRASKKIDSVLQSTDNPFCNSCKEPDCCIDTEDYCSMVRVYRKAKLQTSNNTTMAIISELSKRVAYLERLTKGLNLSNHVRG